MPSAWPSGRFWLRWGVAYNSEPPTNAMKSRPRPGQAAESTFIVEARHAIDFANDGMPAVLATPWLIWFMEHTAREAMLPHLEPTESTVGAVVEIEHLAPTPLGQARRCIERRPPCVLEVEMTARSLLPQF